MVGLVIVSHSRDLANALSRLTRQVSAQDLPVAVAAGIGDDRSEFGTDAVEIAEAIRSVHSSDGVLVMMDLGSAVLSAQLALEFLEPEIAASVRFCAAPFVEGCIAAGVQIGLGSDIDTVYNEARQALLPKQEQIGENPPAAAETAAAVPAVEPSGQQITLTLHNLHGLHARPAARFVQTASGFKAEIFVTDLTNGKGPVTARSLNSIATLGAVEQHQIRVTASGPQADEALSALKALVEGNFGEPVAPQPGTPRPPVPAAAGTSPLPEGASRAIAISEGIAIGPLYRYQPQLPSISRELTQNPEEE